MRSRRSGRWPATPWCSPIRRCRASTPGSARSTGSTSSRTSDRPTGSTSTATRCPRKLSSPVTSSGSAIPRPCSSPSSGEVSWRAGQGRPRPTRLSSEAARKAWCRALAQDARPRYHPWNPMARLLFRDSQGREGTVELTPTETVYVGRGLECAIRTDDGMVSRRHSQIRMEGGRYVVEDLGSANGTHLNNIRVQKQALGHTDIIQCGSLMIRFIDEGAVNIVRPQMPAAMGAAPPGKKGGTMVLERNDAPPLT